MRRARGRPRCDPPAEREASATTNTGSASTNRPAVAIAGSRRPGAGRGVSNIASLTLPPGSAGTPRRSRPGSRRPGLPSGREARAEGPSRRARRRGRTPPSCRSGFPLRRRAEETGVRVQPLEASIPKLRQRKPALQAGFRSSLCDACRASGSGPRLVLVHGSVAPGWLTWNARVAARRPLRARRPIQVGYPPNPALDSIDFDVQAEELAGLLGAGRPPRGALLRCSPRPAARGGAGAACVPDGRRAPRPRARGDPAVEAFLAHFEAGAPKDPRGYLEVLPPARRVVAELCATSPAGDRGRRPGRDRGAFARPGCDTARRARGDAVPQARRLGGTQCRLRCCLRRPRGTPRRAACGRYSRASTRSQASASRSTRCWRRSSRARRCGARARPLRAGGRDDSSA